MIILVFWLLSVVWKNGDDSQKAAGMHGGGLLECTFPEWATNIGVLHSFALTSQYTFSEDRRTMTMANYSHLSKEAFPASISKCQRIVEELKQVSSYTRLVVKVTAQW
jgi:hypothetical protein